MWRDIRDWLTSSSRMSSQTQCSCPSERISIADSLVGSASAERIATADLMVHVCAHAHKRSSFASETPHGSTMVMAKAPRRFLDAVVWQQFYKVHADLWCYSKKRRSA